MSAQKPAEPTSPVLTVYQQIDEACGKFEDAWRAKGQPRIEDFLAGVPEEQQPKLFQELLHLDLELRKEKSRLPPPKEYIDRFPRFQELISAVYQSLTPWPPAPPLVPPVTVEAQPTKEIPAPKVQRKERAAREQAEPESYPFLSPPLEPGELGWLGPYKVRKRLGMGGMGLVFLAEDTQLQRAVALKVLKPEMIPDLPARQRFLREARAMASLRNDHVATIYQVGQDHDVPFMAMEFLQGESLEDCFAEGKPLPTAEVIRIGRDVARGLAAAHEAGLIHRDIKPANLWLEKPSGRVKILDFGMVRTSRSDQRLTKSGYVVGTPAYMAPEQAMGRQLDCRCDLFSLGCVLYQMATGAFPFSGETTLDLVTSIVREKPKPPQQLNPDLPVPLAALILHMLAKDPVDRPASAQAVVNALDAIEKGSPVSLPSAPPEPAPQRAAAPPLRRSRLRLNIVVPAVLIVLVGIAIFWLLSKWK